MKRVAVIPGDGIGPEVIAEAVKVLELACAALGSKIELTPYPWGADHYLATGVTLPPDGLAEMRTYDAIFLGAMGDPRIPDMRHGADILLGMRFGLDLYVNKRP